MKKVWTVRGVLPLVIGALVLTTGACGDDDDGPTIILSQQVKEFGTGDPIPNVEVCVYGRSGDYCDTSDASGNFSVMAPADDDVEFSYFRDGYWPVVIAAHTPSTDWTVPDNAYLVDEVTVEVAWAPVVTTFDDAKGHFMFTVYDAAVIEGASTLAEVSMSVSPAPGGDLAFMGDNTLMDDTMTETDHHGVGAIANMDPGSYTVTLSHPTLTCGAVYGIPGDQPNTFDVEVYAGWTTWLVVYCD